MASLLRLTVYLKRYAWSFWLAVAGMLLSRVFEGMILLFAKSGIDSIAQHQPPLTLGDISCDAARATLASPALCIVL
ncbi:MAG: hypothetical protein QF921_10290 [Pseudomonadales bacterium]|jgi:hypothetical protein|nr:hypothetical protein [Pseudomonadales bacterium]MDP6469723.1 hypothetical protein [Pseudomonadales bacterium]MDP6827676.1 hypothetical protein [Pseudomonadales bacterium]MDP6971884.1 hypothetical protein [Pseudomonadales bacterium]|tara:strand:- start:2534 stop:2764 length:231 start_codon:yes stop_codon:yes gene_type:complete